MDTSPKISLNEKKIFHELSFLSEDPELRTVIKNCVAAQKKTSEEMLKNSFKPGDRAAREVSPEALDEILKRGEAINGIRTEREISNVIVFKDKAYADAVFGEELAAAREKVDQGVVRKMRGLFKEGAGLEVRGSGFFLYPPQGYMGWHTNWQNPGWRLYINYAEEPGKSFFRYRDADTGKIVTSLDREFNVRLFRVSEDKPFWHAVYSDTYRYSLGFKITKTPGIFQRLHRKFSK